MLGRLPLFVVFIGFLNGCSNLMTADPPEHILAGAHEFGTTALAFTPDGQRFISGGVRGDLRVWDAATLHPVNTLSGHRGAVRAILPLTLDDFVSGGDDGRLIAWHGDRMTAQATSANVTALASFQGLIVSGHGDRRLRVWSAETLQLLREIPLDGGVVALSAHADLLAVGLQQAILLLDPDFRTRRTLPTPHTPHDLQFSPDGRT